MKLYIKSLFVAVLLIIIPISAAGRGGNQDSLLNAAAEHTRHGRFTLSREILEGMIENLSKRDRRSAYEMLAVNADLAGEYSDEFRYLQLSGAGRKEDIRQISLLPRQSVSKPSSDVSVVYSIDSLYHEEEFKGCMIRMPAVIGGKEERMILDNGCAKFSFASESFARSHSINPVGVNGVANGVVDTSAMWIGICDSISIGELVFRNILFIVVPDRKLENPVAKLDVIMGSNMLRLAGELMFDNTKRTVTFPAVQDNMPSNMSYERDGLQYVDVEFLGDSLRFHLDLGSTWIMLNGRYYSEFKEKVESVGVRGTRTKGGVGGMETIDVYSISDLTFTTCGGSVSQSKTFVSLEIDSFSGNNYGSVGANFLLSFKRAVFNLEKMYFHVD